MFVKDHNTFGMSGLKDVEVYYAAQSAGIKEEQTMTEIYYDLQGSKDESQSESSSKVVKLST